MKRIVLTTLPGLVGVLMALACARFYIRGKRVEALGIFLLFLLTLAVLSTYVFVYGED